MEPHNNAQWILNTDNWGGIPEMKILSEHYKKLIYVVDVPS